jgi:hypothetical protein
MRSTSWVLIAIAEKLPSRGSFSGMPSSRKSVRSLNSEELYAPRVLTKR